MTFRPAPRVSLTDYDRSLLAIQHISWEGSDTSFTLPPACANQQPAEWKWTSFSLLLTVAAWVWYSFLPGLVRWFAE